MKKIVSQHCVLLMDMVFKRRVRKLKLWSLRKSEVKEEFAGGINNNCGGNEDWCGLKRKLLDVLSEVCAYT